MKKVSLFKLAIVGLFATANATTDAEAFTRDSRAPKKLMARWATGTPEPGKGLPGWYSRTPDVHVSKARSGPPISVAEIDLLRRRAMIAFDALMQQPSLKDVRGSSLQADINISVVPTIDGTRLVGASFSILAKGIAEGKAGTIMRDGRYITPWEEGSVLRVYLNPYDMMARRDVHAEGIQGMGMQIRTGSAFGIYRADRLPDYDPNSEYAWVPRPLAMQLKDDRSWYQPGSPGVFPLAVHLSSYTQQNDDLRLDRLDPESTLSLLAAAMFMVDWEDVRQRMKAVS